MLNLSTSNIEVETPKIEKIENYMSDCPSWQDLCSYFDDFQRKIDEEFGTITSVCAGGFHG